MGEHQLKLRRSGFAEWVYGTADAFDLLGLLLWPIGFLGNVLTHLLVFRGGWTIHVHAANGGYRKVRYRSRKAARADLENQRELAATIPPPPDPPTKARLPTRGGDLREPR